VLEPWRSGTPVLLGDREWEPRECALRVLEGTTLAPEDLALGRGWQRAERTGEDVTERLLSGGAAIAVLASSAAAEARATAALGAAAVPWRVARAQLLAGEGPTRVLVVLDGTEPDGFAFEAGLAYGARPGRVMVARVGDAAPPGWLRGVEALTLEDALRRL
jgi:hypothetical protein